MRKNLQKTREKERQAREQRSQRKKQQRKERLAGIRQRLGEFFLLPPQERAAKGGRKEKLRKIFRLLSAAAVIALVIWYCATPDFYAGEETTGLFETGKTYVIFAAALILLPVCLLPNHLSERLNRILGYLWCLASPFAVYFSLWYMNAEKYHIVLANLNPIAVGFTFWFLYLVLLFLLVLTGSIRGSVTAMAVAVAVLGIVNRFVISFRGTAISAADLFSLQTALTVAGSYSYKIIWDMFAEICLTFVIVLVSFKLRPFRLFGWKIRTVVLCAWLVLAGSFYHICCGTSYLEDHDIRTWGYTHQLRYKQYDMLFTTLLTCFYLAVDKPEGYSLEKVKEIAAEYLDEETSAADGTSEDGDAQGDASENSASEKDTADTAAENDGAEGAASEEDTAENAAAEDDSAESAAAEDASAESAAADDTEEETQQPDIIVIMNESLADYANIGKGLEFSEDPLEFMHSLTENTIKGTVYVSIFGANTPNSEYEFLTGNTMGFLPATSVGFNLFVRGNMPSLASELKSVGYYTLAMHPYKGTNYRRNIVYPQIGFDTYYSRTDFTDATYIRKYISDDSLVDRIIEEYEKHQEEDPDTPLFSYNVTIQNHGGYTASNNANLDLSIKVLTTGMSTTAVMQHTNLVHASDQALEKLITYFSEQEDPVIVITFGDHQANLGDSLYNYLIGEEESLTAEELMEKYKVPFLAWANYDIEEEVIEKTSLNYLYSLLAERLGLPMTGYQTYLYELSQEIPVLTAGGYWTADGSFYELDDEDSPYYEKINEYNILEYNYILGKNDRYLEFFSLNAG